MNTLLTSLQAIFLENPIAQTIWVLAFLVSVYNFLFCKDKKFIIVTAIASALWWMHYLILGLFAAAWINLFDVFKNMIALKYKKNLPLVISFTLVYIIIWIYTYTGQWISVIPTLTAILWTYLVFYVRWVWLNAWFIVIVLMWMSYNYIWNSIGWLWTDIFLIGFWIIGIIRQILTNKKQ